MCHAHWAVGSRFGANGLLSRYTPANGGSVLSYAFDPSGNVAQTISAPGTIVASGRSDGIGDQWGYTEGYYGKVPD